MEHAKINLLKENYKSAYCFVVGSPMKEIYLNIKEKINKSNILEKFNLEIGNYFVWSTHREDNIDNENNFREMINSINMLAKKYKKKIIFGAHPRTMKKLKSVDISP